jgi:hypothetical protein
MLLDLRSMALLAVPCQGVTRQASEDDTGCASVAKSIATADTFVAERKAVSGRRRPARDELHSAEPMRARVSGPGTSSPW